MAGTNKSYHRKSTWGSHTTKTRTNSYGQQETYKQYDFYLYSPGNGSPVMSADGRCISHPGLAPQYHAHGPTRTNLNTTVKTGIKS